MKEHRSGMESCNMLQYSTCFTCLVLPGLFLSNRQPRQLLPQRCKPPQISKACEEDKQIYELIGVGKGLMKTLSLVMIRGCNFQFHSNLIRYPNNPILARGEGVPPGHLMQVLIAGMLTAFHPAEQPRIPSRAGLGQLPVLLGYEVYTS